MFLNCFKGKTPGKFALPVPPPVTPVLRLALDRSLLQISSSMKHCPEQPCPVGAKDGLITSSTGSLLCLPDATTAGLDLLGLCCCIPVPVINAKDRLGIKKFCNNG